MDKKAKEPISFDIITSFLGKSALPRRKIGMRFFLERENNWIAMFHAVRYVVFSCALTMGTQNISPVYFYAKH